MDLLHLRATIGLDSSEYEQGLKDAEGKADSMGSKIGSAFSKVGKAVGAAVTVGSAAVGAFGLSVVKAGASFDSAMSQVAATMGTTVDQIGNLRDFAQQMGASTAFSATEAAEALNYMALAGYDAETSMSMLPNVLNLAAAGGMQLATASDMVTDAQSALGLTLEETTTMVDQMAKGSSKTNTSVQQLGEAFLTVGATARNLAGGTQELSTVLGILADNGIKGSEGGTVLRNAIISLQTPTKDGTEALAKLGMTYADMYDEAGNMKALPEIFQDISASMEGMTQQSKDAIVSGIFNKADLAGVNALIGTNAERWDEVTAAIGDATGAAQEMANTQLDNLEGSITLFKSALEGVQIAISDELSPALKEFVDFGAQGLSDLSTAFKEGGLDGAIESLTGSVENGLVMITEKLPSFIQAGTQLVVSLGVGIINALPNIVSSIASAIPTVFTTIVNTISQNSGSIMTAFSNIWEMVTNGIRTFATDIAPKLAEGIRTGLPTLISEGLNLLMNFTGELRANFGTLVDSGIEILMSLIDGIISAFPEMVRTIPTIISNIAGLINDNAPKILEAGITLIVHLAKGLIQAIPTIIQEIPKIIQAMYDVFTAFNWAALGSKVITFIGNGIKAVATALPNILKNIGTTAANVFKSINWAQVGTTIINLLANGISALKSLVVNALKTIGTNAWNAFKSIDWLSLGRNVVQGLINGVVGLGKNFVSSVVNLGKQAFNGIKDFFKISSPSKLFRDDIGKNLVLGLANGVKQNQKYAKASMEEMGQAILDVAQKTLDNYKVYQDISLKDEVKYWEQVREQTQEGTQARIDADKKLIDAQLKWEDRRATLYEKSLSLTQTFNEKYTKAYQDAADKITQAQEKYNEDYAKSTETLVKNMTKTWEDLEKEVAKINEDLQKDIDKINDNYNKSVESRANAIMGYTGLFDRVKQDETKSRNELLGALQEQVTTLEDWDAQLDELADKIGQDNPLMQQIQAMGTSTLGTLKELNKMSEEELAQYVELFNRKQILAQERSEQENAALRAQSDAEIEELKQDADAKIEAARTKATMLIWEYKNQSQKEKAELKEALQKTSEEINKEAETEMNKLQAQYVADLDELAFTCKDEGDDVGELMMQGMKEGIENNQSIVTEAARSAAQQAYAAAMAALQIHSPSKKFAWIGEMVDKGFAEGITSGQSEVIDSMNNLTGNLTGSARTGSYSNNMSGSSPVTMLLSGIYDFLLTLPDGVRSIIYDAISNTTFSMNDREFARLVRAV